jgi:hypothetical protein
LDEGDDGIISGASISASKVGTVNSLQLDRASKQDSSKIRHSRWFQQTTVEDGFLEGLVG